MIADTLRILLESMEKARQNAPLAARPVLLAASKGQPTETILEAIEAGVEVFGENRVQEADEKWEKIKQTHPHIQLHLIGPLQTNKVKQALEIFDVIQTLDRPKLAVALAKELENKKAIPQLFIQVNTGEEPQKTGILPAQADEFIRYCKDELGLPVTGLMCIPPADDVPAPHFALLSQIAKRHDLKELSMGMSNDYEIAIRMGATMIRIGTKLFGERE